MNSSISINSEDIPRRVPEVPHSGINLTPKLEEEQSKSVPTNMMTSGKVFLGEKNIAPEVVGVTNEEIDEIIKELETEAGEIDKTVKKLKIDQPFCESSPLDNMAERFKYMVSHDPKKLPDATTKKNVEETRKLIETFKDKTSNYPKYISYEGSMVICVMLSMKDTARLHVSNLPIIDQEVIKGLWPVNASAKAPSCFSVRFDEIKDFVFFDFSGAFKEFSVNIFNAVAHPRPEDLKDMGPEVPVEDTGDKIAVGGKILMNKKTIQKIMGNSYKDPKKELPTQLDEEYVSRRQPVAGRNAFELRTDILAMAVDYHIHNKNNMTPDEIVKVAKIFYSFVENRR
jgi:hypothetical protein